MRVRKWWEVLLVRIFSYRSEVLPLWYLENVIFTVQSLHNGTQYCFVAEHNAGREWTQQLNYLYSVWTLQYFSAVWATTGRCPAMSWTQWLLDGPSSRNPCAHNFIYLFLSLWFGNRQAWPHCHTLITAHTGPLWVGLSSSGGFSGEARPP